MPSLNEQREAEGQKLLVARGQAIDAYAGLEKSLSFLLATFAETSLSIASVILFRIGAHPRNLILDELRSTRFGDQYENYYVSLMKLIRQLDQARNQIIHWHTTISLSTDTASVGLSRPSTWFEFKDTAPLTINEINQFTIKCSFVSRSINLFVPLLQGTLQKDPNAHATWHEICQKPIIYPPPKDHPLYRSHQELEDRLFPSQP
jgi:hypothetical protein